MGLDRSAVVQNIEASLGSHSVPDKAFLRAKTTHIVFLLRAITLIVKEGSLVLSIRYFHELRNPLVISKWHPSLNLLLSKRLNLYLIKVDR